MSDKYEVGDIIETITGGKAVIIGKGDIGEYKCVPLKFFNEVLGRDED